MEQIKPEHIEENSNNVEHSIERERDEEYEEILASAQVKEVKVVLPFENGEVMDLDDD